MCELLVMLKSEETLQLLFHVLSLHFGWEYVCCICMGGGLGLCVCMRGGVGWGEVLFLFFIFKCKWD